MPTSPKLPPVPTGAPSEVAELIRVLQRTLDDQVGALNRVLEGRISEWKSSHTTPPRGGLWSTGDRVRNTDPQPQGAAPDVYVVEGWLCIETGTPGTWVELRVPFAYYGDPPPAPAPTPTPTPTPAPTPSPTPIYDEQYTVDVGNAIGNNVTLSIVDSDYMRVTNSGAAFGNAHIVVDVVGGVSYQIDWDARAGTGGTPALHVGSPTLWNEYAESTTDKPFIFVASGSGAQTVYIGPVTDSTVSGAYVDYDYITVTPETGAPSPSPAPTPSPPPTGTPPPAGVTYEASSAAITAAHNANMAIASAYTSNKNGTHMSPIPEIYVGDITDFASAGAAYPLGATTNMPGNWDAVVTWFWVKPIQGTPDNANGMIQCGFTSVQIYNTGTSAWEYLFFDYGMYGAQSGGNSADGAPAVPELTRGGLLIADCNNVDLELWPADRRIVNNSGARFIVATNDALLDACGAVYAECAARLVKRDLNGPDDLDSMIISARLGYDAYVSAGGAQRHLRASDSWTWGRDGAAMDGGGGAIQRVTRDWKVWSTFTVDERGGPYKNGTPPPWSGNYQPEWAYDGCSALTWWQANPPSVLQIPTDYEPA